MAYFSLSNFISTVAQTGLARTNRFEMIITPPAALAAASSTAEQVSLMCEITNLPPLTVQVRPHAIYGPPYQRPVGLDYGGDAIAATFLLDSNMNVKRFFDEWILSIVDRYSYNVSFPREYASYIYINQLNERDDETYSLYLEDAFPRSINVIDLNHAAQNQVQRMTVVFAYRRWYPASDRQLPDIQTLDRLRTQRLPPLPVQNRR